jgi:pyruvate formate lyase activating enzyme
MKKISRRDFLWCSAAVLATPAISYGFLPFDKKKGILKGPADIRGRIFKNDAPDELWKWSKKAYFSKEKADGRVMCGICPNHCLLSPGDRSICRSRVNIDGKLYTLVYGNPCAVNLDPIEKKPLYHFKPATAAFSIATTGCNFRCLNCQNWEISQVKPDEVRHVELFPGDVVKKALQVKADSIAYTYSEAVTFYEYMIDTAEMAKEQGLSNLLISNGYINRRPLLRLCKSLDAANINLKAYSDAIYKKLNGGRLQPVLNTFKTLHEQGVHFEITNLVVPGYVDNEDMLKEMCGWILENLGPDYPLHFLRFFPKYKLNRLAPTPISTLTDFRSLAIKEGIRYVYIGGVPGHAGNSTWCHNCRKLLIERQGYFITQYNLIENKCKYCHTVIPGEFTTSRGGQDLRS